MMIIVGPICVILVAAIAFIYGVGTMVLATQYPTGHKSLNWTFLRGAAISLVMFAVGLWAISSLWSVL